MIVVQQALLGGSWSSWAWEANEKQKNDAQFFRMTDAIEVPVEPYLQSNTPHPMFLGSWTTSVKNKRNDE